MKESKGNTNQDIQNLNWFLHAWYIPCSSSRSIESTETGFDRDSNNWHIINRWIITNKEMKSKEKGIIMEIDQWITSLGNWYMEIREERALQLGFTYLSIGEYRLRVKIDRRWRVRTEKTNLIEDDEFDRRLIGDDEFDRRWWIWSVTKDNERGGERQRVMFF